MSELMEKQLVEKVNMALGLMAEGEESRLALVKFVGANKERGSGGVTYEMNTVDVVFKSLVWSGLLTIFRRTKTVTG